MIDFRDIIPLLIDFIKDRPTNWKFEKFEIPKYYCGRNGDWDMSRNFTRSAEASADNGIIILEDLSAQGYNLVDADFMMLNLEEMTVL